MNLKKIIAIILFTAVVVVAYFLMIKKDVFLRPKTDPVQTLAASSNIVIPQKTCPDGFVIVPGNPLYHTSDFCIMKYEAKCADVSDPTIGLEPARGNTCSGEKNGHYYNVYNNSGAGCSCTGTREIVSTKSGFPIAYIPETSTISDDAKSYCAEKGWHLTTNDEWMTIARNVEQVSDNWCDLNGTNCSFLPGTIGKILANGHNDNNNEKSANGSGTDGALVAGDDNQPCFETTTDGSNNCGGKGSQKRTLVLDNGSLLWDFAGNVWEWVDSVVPRKDEPQSASHGVRDIGWLKSDFAPGSLASVLTDNGQGSTLGYDAFRPSDPTWNANNGVGRIYHYGSKIIDTDTTLYTFIRGGNWKHGMDDGAFTIHMSPPPDRTGIDDTGFRCVDSL